MDTAQQNTAILLFTRHAKEEASIKDFAQHFKANQLIAGKMIAHTMGVIKKSGLPCFVIDSLHQHGNNFAERFTNAIEQVFLSGFERIVMIGNDCPALNPQDLQRAAAGLLLNDYVLGPSNDGGFYLFGINKSAFRKMDLLNAAWGSENLCSSFIQNLQQLEITFLLADCKHDMDSKQDLLMLIESKNIAVNIANYVRSVIASLTEYISLIRFYTLHKDIVYLATLRAPPRS